MLDRLSNMIAARPGMLPLLGVLLIIANFIIQFIPLGAMVWLADTNLLLHLGAIIGLIGILLARALQ